MAYFDVWGTKRRYYDSMYLAKHTINQLLAPHNTNELYKRGINNPWEQNRKVYSTIIRQLDYLEGSQVLEFENLDGTSIIIGYTASGTIYVQLLVPDKVKEALAIPF